MLAALYVSSLSHDVSRRFSAPKTCVVLCAPHTGAGGGMLLELAGACECANQRRMLSSSNIFATTTFKTQNKHMVRLIHWFIMLWFLGSHNFFSSDMTFRHLRPTRPRFGSYAWRLCSFLYASSFEKTTCLPNFQFFFANWGSLCSLRCQNKWSISW